MNGMSSEDREKEKREHLEMEDGKSFCKLGFSLCVTGDLCALHWLQKPFPSFRPGTGSVFSSTSSPLVHWKPLPHSQANQRQPSHSQALHHSCSPFWICSTPKPPGALSPISSAQWHPVSSSAFPPGCTFHVPLPLPWPEPLHAGLQHSFPDGCGEKGWEDAGASALPKIPLQAADGSWCSSTPCNIRNVLCLQRDGFAFSLNST